MRIIISNISYQQSLLNDMQIYFPAYVENKATGSASLGYESELLMDLNIINHTYPHLLHVGLTICKYKPFV